MTKKTNSSVSISKNDVNVIKNQVDSLSALIFKAAESNESKLEFIKNEIATNKYIIDSLNIAEKLLEFVPIVTKETAVAQ